MSTRMLSRGLVLLAGLALAIATFATPMKKTIHIRQPLQVGDKTLAAGDYNVVVDGNETTFSKGNKVITKVSCEVSDAGAKSTQDAVLYENGAIIELRFSGQSQVVKFNPEAAGAAPSKPTSTLR